MASIADSHMTSAMFRARRVTERRLKSQSLHSDAWRSQAIACCRVDLSLNRSALLHI